MSKRSSVSGITLIELLIVLGIAAVLIAVGATQFNPNGAAVNQAAEVVSAAANRARFEAVKTNSTAGLEIVSAIGGSSGSITICREVDITAGLSCANGIVSEVITFDGGSLARAIIADPTSVNVYFDRRGVVRNPAQHVITVSDRSGSNTRTVTISPTGRAEVN